MAADAQPTAPPESAEALMQRAGALRGQSLSRLAGAHGVTLPASRRNGKGFAGGLIERILGADAGNLPEPDFRNLGIELKTIPVDLDGAPRESTYVCVAPAAGAPWGTFADSILWRKLACVLFVPLITSPEHTLGESIVGRPRLWRPNARERALLEADWGLLAEALSVRGESDGRMGEVLQLRPKAAHARDLRPGFDAAGAPAPSLPRGFYLRPAFTRALLHLAETDT